MMIMRSGQRPSEEDGRKTGRRMAPARAVILAGTAAALCLAAAVAVPAGYDAGAAAEAKAFQESPRSRPHPSRDARQAASVDASGGTDAAADPFGRFRHALDDAGYGYEMAFKAAGFVGASEGEGYRFDFGSAELYRFDEGSDALAKAKEDGGLAARSLGLFLPCEFNGNLALCVDAAGNEDAILDIFASL